MKRFVFIVSFLLLTAVLIAPFSVSAAEQPGIKPGSFFYGFVTAFEKVNLFFTFNPEKKAGKALKYAEKRLAEAEAVAGDKNSDAVKTAISGYEKSIALAAEASKKVKDEARAENLLNLIADNTSKHQEVLTGVLSKVPDEAKEAITRALEASRKGQEEAMNKIAELRQEVAGLKQEIAELKKQQETKPATSQNNGAQSQSTSIKELKKEVEELKKQTTTPSAPAPAAIQSSTQQTEAKAEDQTVSTGVSTELLEITSVSIAPERTSAKIEWQTNKPTSAKVFLSGGGLSSKVYGSESGLSTRHIVNTTGLTSDTTYSYEIESIAGDQVNKKDGAFSTKPDEYTISVQPDKTSVMASGWHSINFKISALKNGLYQSQKSVSIATPDPAQNRTITTNSISSTGSNDWSGSYSYTPKTVGIHKLVFSWNGVSKGIDIQAIEYVKIDPKFERRTIYQQDANNLSYPVEIPEYQIGYQNATIAAFGLSDADEPFRFDEIEFETDIDVNKLRIPARAAAGELNTSGTLYQIQINDNITGVSIGTHTFTIKGIKVVGIKSGDQRTVQGLPITFTFKIK